MSIQAAVTEALTNGTPVLVADVCDLLGTEATTRSGQPFTVDDGDLIDHDAVDRLPVIQLVAELNAWQAVADYIDLEV